MAAFVGFGILVATAILFWRVLPREGKAHALVGTPWEPYVTVLMICGLSVGVGLISTWFSG